MSDETVTTASGQSSLRRQGEISTSASHERDGHIPALDGVRGVAILLVLILHFSAYGHGLAPSALLIDRLYYRVAGAGWIGVDLFFVLSGFLITGILCSARASEHYLRNFYARRVLRIFPLYYGALILLVVLLPWFWPDNAGIDSMARDAPWYWTYLSNLKIARDGWPESGAIGHFWSLAVEEQFYLVWPLIVMALGRRQLQYACLVCIVGALAIRVSLNMQGNSTAAFVLTPARMDALAVGAYLAVSARVPGGLQHLSRLASRTSALSFIALVVVFAARKGFRAYDPVVSTIGHTLVACFFGAVLVLALTSPRRSVIARTLESSFLGFFGRYA